MKISGALSIAAVFVACFQTVPAHGAGSSAVVKVSATVLPYMKLHAHQRVATYRVTTDDLRKGFVDLPDSATVRIRTNENKNIALSVSNEGPERIMVREAGAGTYDGADGTVVLGRPQKGMEITRNLDFRLILPEGAKEGSYALNIAITPYTF